MKKRIKGYLINSICFVLFYYFMLFLKGVFLGIDMNIEFILLVAILFDMLGGYEL